MTRGLRHDDGLPTRRSILKSGMSMGLAGLLLSTVPGCTSDNRPARITVAGGETGGFYLEFATLLAESLQRHGVTPSAMPLTTGGSLENLERMLSGEATFAIALADAAAQQAATGPVRMTALGKVYENYVHCLVRRDSGIRTFNDLAGKTVAVGEARSGTSLTAHRIIVASGLPAIAAGSAAPAAVAQPHPDALKEVNLGLNQGLAALRNKSVDALFWSGGVPTAAITATNKDVGLSLLDLSAMIPAMRAANGPFYDRVLIPDNSYEGASAVWTVGVANLLLCRSDLDDQTVKRTVELLVSHAEELIPRSSMGVQFLSPETLINTAGVPLHPAAAEAYRTLHG